ncbi:MAG TPA: hypothetical protein PLS50_05210, partial [Candidatus Dojkabacteria bacterium]|nr:hypothetical protein [Candidatus Dojkabacteria bacterium]
KMNNQEQGPVYDFVPNDTGRRLLMTGLLSIANGISVWAAYSLVQMDSEFASMATKFVAGIHGLQIASAGLQIIRDLRTPDPRLHDGGVMARGWRERIAKRNLVFNVMPLFVSLATLSALYAGNSTPTPLPTPGGEIQV